MLSYFDESNYCDIILYIILPQFIWALFFGRLQADPLVRGRIFLPFGII